jgi:ribosomal subunit interface protein
MVELSITAKHVELSERLEKYVHGRVSKLEKYVPRVARDDTRIEVKLSQENSKGAPSCVCEIALHLPQVNLVASETTRHIYAAVDVAVAHVREQLKTYKAKRVPRPLRERLREGRHTDRGNS